MARIQRNFIKGFLIFSLLLGISVVLGAYWCRGRYVINISASLPMGIYKLYEIKDKKIDKGDIVMFLFPEEAEKYIRERKYLPDNVNTLLKRVVAVEGDKVEAKNKTLYINDQEFWLGKIREKDSKGLPLPIMKSKTLEKDEYFVFGTHPTSFDSRYYGVIKRELILKKAELVWEF